MPGPFPFGAGVRCTRAGPGEESSVKRTRGCPVISDFFFWIACLISKLSLDPSQATRSDNAVCPLANATLPLSVSENLVSVVLASGCPPLNQQPSAKCPCLPHVKHDLSASLRGGFMRFASRDAPPLFFLTNLAPLCSVRCRFALFFSPLSNLSHRVLLHVKAFWPSPFCASRLSISALVPRGFVHAKVQKPQ